MSQIDVSSPALRQATPMTDKTLAFVAWGSMIVFPLIGPIIAFIDRGRGNAILDSHYSYLIRTFFVSLLFVVIGCALLLVAIGGFILLGTVVWYYVRIVKGLIKLARNEPIASPKTWWI